MSLKVRSGRGFSESIGLAYQLSKSHLGFACERGLTSVHTMASTHLGTIGAGLRRLIAMNINAPQIGYCIRYSGEELNHGQWSSSSSIVSNLTLKVSVRMPADRFVRLLHVPNVQLMLAKPPLIIKSTVSNSVFICSLFRYRKDRQGKHIAWRRAKRVLLFRWHFGTSSECGIAQWHPRQNKSSVHGMVVDRKNIVGEAWLGIGSRRERPRTLTYIVKIAGWLVYAFVLYAHVHRKRLLRS